MMFLSLRWYHVSRIWCQTSDMNTICGPFDGAVNILIGQINNKNKRAEIVIIEAESAVHKNSESASNHKKMFSFDFMAKLIIIVNKNLIHDKTFIDSIFNFNMFFDKGRLCLMSRVTFSLSKVVGIDVFFNSFFWKIKKFNKKGRGIIHIN